MREQTKANRGQQAPAQIEGKLPRFTADHRNASQDKYRTEIGVKRPPGRSIGELEKELRV